MRKLRRKIKLQQFAAEPNTITTNQIKVNPREVDFVTSFGRSITALTEVLGISRPIRKENGTELSSFKVTGELESGEVAEGDEIPLSQFSVVPVPYGKIALEKFAKAVTIEAIANNGADRSIDATDDEFQIQLQDNVLSRFYNFLLTGTLNSEETTWQMAVAMAVGRVKDSFKKMHRAATSVAVFVNTIDLYAYLGGSQVTVQTAFGMDYLENFLGADLVFISSEIPQGRVVATPTNNIVVYYIDPSNSEFSRAGLAYTVDPQVPYIGYHSEGNYRRAQAESYAIMGLTVFAEYLSAVAVITVADAPELTEITVTPSAGTATGTTKATVSGNTTSNLKYRLADAAVPVKYGQNVRNWPAFTASADITAEDGQQITVVEYDKYYKAVGSGSAAVTVKSE